MQKHKNLTRVIAVVLSTLMLLSVLPIAASAVETTEHSLTIASKTKTALAPGVTETSVVSYDKNGKRVQYFVVDCNVNNGTTQVKANYHDNDNTGVWGKATVVEQANAAKAKRGYNVVASTNASYYNVSTGQPTGAFVMEGVNINGTATGNTYQFFAQLDDGTYMIGDKGEFGNVADHVVEAVGGHLMLVKNGAVVAGLNANDKYPRSTVGLKADGSVVLMLADGNNQPYSIGLTYAEQAQLMLELGCVDAIELDGGGSATYAAKPEGSDEIEVRNVCCDGTVRSVSNTLMVISTAVSDGTFDHANLSTDYPYYAPNSDVAIAAAGADAAGGAAEIPDGVTWSLATQPAAGEITDGYYLVGDMNNWQANAAFKFAENPNNQGEYMLDCTFANDAQFKAVKVENGNTTWIPGGENNNISVTAGTKTIYFKPEETNNDGWIGDGKHFYVADQESFGTIENGVFHSSGKLGTVTASMLLDNEVVGSIDITVVNPDSIAFSASEKTVPYGKSADFSITAMYNGAEMFAPASAYSFECTAGNMDGFMYYSPDDESIAVGTVTATYNYAEMNPISVAVTFGKGSEVLFDFEDGDVSQWLDWRGMEEAIASGAYTGGYTMPYKGVETNWTSAASNNVAAGIKEGTFLATKENGKVHSGNYALGYTFDYTQGASFQNWMYGYLYYTGEKKVFRDTANGITGTRIGMWMYIPEEAVGSCSRLAYTYKAANGTISTAYLYFTYQYVKKGFSKLTSDKIPEAGWAYVYCDLDDISSTFVSTSYYKNEDGSLTRAEASNYAPAFIQWIVSSSAKGAENVTFYIDDITLDYSDVVDDRDAPVISNPLALDDLGSYQLNGGTVSTNVLSFTADAVEDTVHNPGNATGIDASSAKVYLDGHAVDAKYSAGKITTGYFTLPNGIHDISFEIADKQGNVTKMTKQITIASEAAYPVVSLVGEAVGNGKVKMGGQYNLNINTDQAEKISKVTTTIWLNSASKWALENATPAKGFTYEYSVNEAACKATITVTNDGSTLTGQQTLLSIPVYAWAWDGSAGVDAHTQWTSGAPNGDGATCPAVTISYKAFLGDVEYVKNEVETPANYIAGFSNIRQDVVTELDSGIANLKNTIGEWHYHDEIPVEDKAPTCTEAGYTGRTICSDPDCNSIINWGTEVPATGHTFAVIDGSIKCENCGEALNGLIELDGKNYYSVNDSLMTGWQQIDNDWYYFDADTYEGIDGTVNSKTVVSTKKNFDLTFENGRLTDGAWVQFDEGWRYYYGPSYYKGRSGVANQQTIDGDLYAFNNDGIRYEGINLIVTSQWTEPKCWVFDSEGKFVEKYTGLYGDGEAAYYLDGDKQSLTGAVQIGNDIYYFGAKTHKTLADGTYYISAELMNDVQLPAGNYQITDGKIVVKNGLVEEDGKLYYYVDNTKIKGAVQVENDIYYFAAKTKTTLDDGEYYISAELMNDVQLPAGKYAIVDGKIVKEGLVVIDGKTYYYKDYAKIAGAVQVDEDIYYFAAKTKTFLDDGEYYISAELMNDVQLPAGRYQITDGKIVVKNGLVEEDGKLYFYNNNTKVKGAVEVDGDYYYFSAKYYALPDGTYYISEDLMNGLLPAGKYQIADYKIVI